MHPNENFVALRGDDRSIPQGEVAEALELEIDENCETAAEHMRAYIREDVLLLSGRKRHSTKMVMCNRSSAL